MDRTDAPQRRICICIFTIQCYYGVPHPAPFYKGLALLNPLRLQTLFDSPIGFAVGAIYERLAACPGHADEPTLHKSHYEMASLRVCFPPKPTMARRFFDLEENKNWSFVSPDGYFRHRHFG